MINLSFFKKDNDDFYNLNQKSNNDEEIEIGKNKVEIKKEKNTEIKEPNIEKNEINEEDDIDIPPFLRKFKKSK
jgi:hypothetical protein